MTATEVRDTIKTVVEAHATHNTFYSIWNDAKDRDTEPTFPFVAWEQWRARLVEDPMGQLCRMVNVRLLIVTSAATDRTPTERDIAVEAADSAAADIVLALRSAYSWNITNIVSSTLFDDKTQLDTGVVLTFSVQSDPICAGEEYTPPDPGVCDPTTVNGEESDTPTITVTQGGNPAGTLNPATGVVTIDECPGGDCPYDILVTLNGVPQAPVTDVDPCVDNNLNIVITYS